MLASLPMYDLPELREATDAFWAAIAQAYGVKGSLTRGDDWTAPWRAPALLFSQTCGYPFTHDYKGVLTYVATPNYSADGCHGPNYCSIVFAREEVPLDALKNKVAAFNNRDSMSGMLALQLVFAPLAREGRFFAGAVETGGHFASLGAVRNGDADVCATDCVTVAYARRYRPQALEGLVEVARSPSVPGLPYVTRSGDPLRLRDALQYVLHNAQYQSLCNELLLTNASELEVSTYRIIPELEDAMLQNGGLILSP